MDVPQSDDEFVDFLIKPTWEGGPVWTPDVLHRGTTVDVPTVATPASADPVAAISGSVAGRRDQRGREHRDDSRRADAQGVDDEPTRSRPAAVVNSYEWRHWGDNWSDWFEGLDLADQ